MNTKTGSVLFFAIASSIAVGCLTAAAASKTDSATTEVAKAPARPAAPKPAPVSGRPEPVTASPKPSQPVWTEAPPVILIKPPVRYRLPVDPPEPRPGSVTTGSSPVKSYPSPASRPAWTRQPTVQSFVQVAIVSFPKGETRSFTTFDAADGHRLEIYSYSVQWHLPRDQFGVIDFAPMNPDDPNGSYHPEGSLSLSAEPGAPLKIYGSRTSGDGSGTAIITFVGEKTPVPFEHKNPAS